MCGNNFHPSHEGWFAISKKLSKTENTYKNILTREFMTIYKCKKCTTIIYCCEFCSRSHGKYVIMNTTSLCGEHYAGSKLLRHLSCHHGNTSYDCMISGAIPKMYGSGRGEGAKHISLYYLSMFLSNPHLILLEFSNIELFVDRALELCEKWYDQGSVQYIVDSEIDISRFETEGGIILVDLILGWDFQCVRCEMEYESGLPAIDIAVEHCLKCFAEGEQK